MVRKTEDKDVDTSPFDIRFQGYESADLSGAVPDSSTSLQGSLYSAFLSGGSVSLERKP